MINKVGIIVNVRKKRPVLLGKQLIQWFEDKGIKVYLTSEDGRALAMDETKILPDLSAVDCVITLGGDGTFLRSARIMSPYGIPILGINLGNLGFLTEIELNEMEEALENLIQGRYKLEDRMMLQVHIIRDRKIINSFVGLNDVVIKGPWARLIILGIYVEDEFVTEYKADGVIIASPTGSTAYSLSAGGPIVHPEVDVTIVTPICPHSLQNRSLVLPPQKRVRVVIVRSSDTMLTIDGQSSFELIDGDEIIIEKAEKYTRLVRIKDYKFFSILQKKLKSEGRTTYE